MFEEAARARAVESNVLAQKGHECGAVYLAGYVVECKLKAFLVMMNRPFPRSGRSGHDLVALWEAAGLRSKDLNGHRRIFLDVWDTSLRYRVTLPACPADAKDLLAGARELSALVTRHMRTAPRRRRGGART